MKWIPAYYIYHQLLALPVKGHIFPSANLVSSYYFAIWRITISRFWSASVPWLVWCNKIKEKICRGFEENIDYDVINQLSESSRVSEYILPPAEGWSRECLQEWGPFLKLAVPSMLMHCLEWWLYEIAGFLAGIVSELELAAQSVMYQLAATAYMVSPPPQRRPAVVVHFSVDRFRLAPQFPIGFSVAASVRVGNALGAGNTERAKLSSKVSIIITRMSLVSSVSFIHKSYRDVLIRLVHDPVTVSCLVGLCLFATKDVIGYIFTTDKWVFVVFGLQRWSHDAWFDHILTSDTTDTDVFVLLFCATGKFYNGWSQLWRCTA